MQFIAYLYLANSKRALLVNRDFLHEGRQRRLSKKSTNTTGSEKPQVGS
jgi:hypothetical protein